MEANTNDMNGSKDKDCVVFPVVHIKEELEEDDDSNSIANLSNADMWKHLAKDLAEVGVDHDHDNSTLTSNAVASLAVPENPLVGGSTDSSPVFIPISSSEIKQIQGSTIRTGSEGDAVFFNTPNQTPCLRLMLNTDGKMEQASGPGGTSIQIQEQANSDQVRINSGGAHGTLINEVRITSISSGEAGGDEHATAANKPRRRGPGRKAKEAKILPKSVRAKKKAKPEKSAESPPNIVVHHTAANYPPPTFRAASIPDFASFDTNAVLLRRHVNGVEINKIPGAGANSATFGMGQAWATPAGVKGAIFRGNRAPATENNIESMNSGASAPGPSIAHVNGGVNNGTIPPPNFTGGTSGASFPFRLNGPNGHPHYSQPPVRIHGWMEHLEQHHRVVSDLRTRLQLASLDNFELRLKLQYIAKHNKELMIRLRQSLQETEALKYKNQLLQIRVEHPTLYSSTLDAPPVENLIADGGNDVQPGESGPDRYRSSQGSSDSGHCDSSPTMNNIVKIKKEPEDQVSPQSGDGDVGNISEGSAQVTGNNSQEEQTATADDNPFKRTTSTIVNLKQAKRELEQESTFSVAPNKKHCTDEQLQK